MSSHQKNLNLLPLLQAVLRHRSVTRAARSLGVSQSAASQGLARLRLQMADPLLVRISGRMQLTPFASTLTSRVENVADALDELFRPRHFDPATSTRVFVIASNDYPALRFARPFLDLQRAEAPGVRLHFIEIGSDYTERMAAQEIDFTLLPRFAVRDFTVAPLRYRTLRTDRLGLLMDRSHPLATRVLVSEADLAGYETIVFHAESLGQIPSIDAETPTEVVPLRHAMRDVAVQTNHFTLIPTLLHGTELVAVVPFEMGAELSRTSPVEVRALSFGPAGIEHGLTWSPVFDADPAHEWMRTRIEKHLKY